MRHLALFFTAALFALPAAADPLPSVVPTRDVNGTYQFTDSDGTLFVAVEYSRDDNKLRLGLQGGGDYILYDFNMNDAKMVLPSQQQYYERPAIVAKMERIESIINSGAANVAAGGQETIAGTSCTDYTPAGNPNGPLICITGDGIILKLLSPDGTSFVAQSLSSDPVPEADMQIPSGYTELTAPP